LTHLSPLFIHDKLTITHGAPAICRKPYPTQGRLVSHTLEDYLGTRKASRAGPVRSPGLADRLHQAGLYRIDFCSQFVAIQAQPGFQPQ